MKENIEVRAEKVLPSLGHYKIFRKGKHVYNLMMELANPMNQDKLAEFYEIGKEKGNPVPMNSVQHYELFNDAVKSGNPDLLNFLQKELQKYPETLTRVIYNPAGEEDETIHNYGTSDSYSIIGDIVGDDNWIKNIHNVNALGLLLKTKDIERLNEISNLINKTPMYLWRFNSKKFKRQERVVGFDAYPGRLNLGADRNLFDEGPAFLVERVK